MPAITNYNHDLDNVAQACGLNEDFFDMFMEKFTHDLKEAKSISRYVQEIEEVTLKSPDKMVRPLIALTVMTMLIAQRKSAALDLLSKISKAKSGEEGDLPSFLSEDEEDCENCDQREECESMKSKLLADLEKLDS